MPDQNWPYQNGNEPPLGWEAIAKWIFPGAGNAAAAAGSSSGGYAGDPKTAGFGGSSTPDPEAAKKKADADAAEAMFRQQQQADLEYRQAQKRALDAQNDPNKTAAEIAKANADVQATQLRMQQIAQEMANFESPGAKRQADLENRLKGDEAEARLRRQEAADQRGFTSGENDKSRAATASESAARRAFDAQQQNQTLAARREEADATAKLTLRSQALDAARMQDTWVMDTIKNQIAAGQLSLGKATSMWDAYVTKAKMPTQILESVSKAIEPLMPYMTSRKAGESAPGFEGGGPLEQIFKRGGATYDPAQYAVRPSSINMMDIAKQAGANWSESGKTPSVSSVFKNVPDIKVNPGESAVKGVPDIGAIQSILPSLPPDVQATDDIRARIAAEVK